MVVCPPLFDVTIKSGRERWYWNTHKTLYSCEESGEYETLLEESHMTRECPVRSVSVSSRCICPDDGQDVSRRNPAKRGAADGTGTKQDLVKTEAC